MQKFPLRMKDNDLLVTELYKDPALDHITAISVYLTPKTTSEFPFSSIKFNCERFAGNYLYRLLMHCRFMWELDRNCVRYKIWFGSCDCSTSGDGRPWASTFSNVYRSPESRNEGKII